MINFKSLTKDSAKNDSKSLSIKKTLFSYFDVTYKEIQFRFINKQQQKKQVSQSNHLRWAFEKCKITKNNHVDRLHSLKETDRFT